MIPFVQISFDLNLGAIAQPLVVLVLAYLVSQARKAIIAHNIEQGRSVQKSLDDQQLLSTKYQQETQHELNEIKVQTTKTNGTVTHLQGTDEELRIEINNVRVHLAELRGVVYAAQGLRPPEESNGLNK